MTLKEAEKRRLYYQYQQLCLEAKLERVEPFSDEFERIVNELYDTLDAIEAAGYQVLKARQREAHARSYLMD